MSIWATTAGTAYQHAHEHLSQELIWLNVLISAHIGELRRAGFYQQPDQMKGFFISDQEIDAILEDPAFWQKPSRTALFKRPPAEKLTHRAREIRRQIDARVQRSREENLYLTLPELSRRFGLNEAESAILLIAAAPYLDSRYERLYSYIQNDLSQKLATVDIALSLLHIGDPDLHPWQHYGLFHPSAPLFKHHLLSLESAMPGAAFLSESIRVEQRIVAFLLGDNTPLAEISLSDDLMLTGNEAPNSGSIAQSAFASITRLADAMLNQPANAPRPVIVLEGVQGVGKKTVAGQACRQLGIPLCIVDLARLIEAADPLPLLLRRIFRESILQPGAIYLDHFEALRPETPEHGRSALENVIWEAVREYGWLTFIGTRQKPPLPADPRLSLFHFSFPRPGFSQRQILWKHYLNGSTSEREIADLANRFELTGEQIRLATETARNRARVNGAAQPHPFYADLLTSAREQSQPRLSVLAKKMPASYRLPDIILPPDQLSQLQEIIACFNTNHIVLDQWGFDEKLSLGKGITALFHGVSGTGKTMAAQVIAAELALDLYRIDLSAVVSKYIGETEKNLNRVFSEARHSNAILFFDEADALFGKRAEVKDAHDRYANIETGYLLQQMEEYDGIVILASNLKKNIDEAFIRRLQFIIDFPFPNHDYREQIWRRIFPAKTPLSPEIDFPFIAQKFKLTGGNIKNIGLRAAHFAAAENCPVAMPHLIRATKRELQKIGKLYTDGDFGPYAALLERTPDE